MFKQKKVSRPSVETAKKDAKQAGKPVYLLTVLVDPAGLELNGTSHEFVDSYKQGNFEIGHVWVRLENTEERVVREGGHTGEEGRYRDIKPRWRKYRRGIYILNWYFRLRRLRRIGIKLTPSLRVEEADPDNPGRWLRYVYQDGRWHGAREHVRHRAEATFVLDKKNWEAACEKVKEFEQSAANGPVAEGEEPLRGYGGFEAGCGYATRQILEAAGIDDVEAYTRSSIELPRKITFNLKPWEWCLPLCKVNIRFWVNEKFKMIEYDYPDGFLDYIKARPSKTIEEAEVGETAFYKYLDPTWEKQRKQKEKKREVPAYPKSNSPQISEIKVEENISAIIDDEKINAYRTFRTKEGVFAEAFGTTDPIEMATQQLGPLTPELDQTLRSSDLTWAGAVTKASLQHPLATPGKRNPDKGMFKRNQR